MKFSDLFSLTTAKLRVYRNRTRTTIIASSALLSLIFAIIFIITSLTNLCLSSANQVYGSQVILSVRQVSSDYGAATSTLEQRALELYDASDNPEKEYPLTDPVITANQTFPPQLITTNQFSAQAISELLPELQQAFINQLADSLTDFGGTVIDEPIEYQVLDNKVEFSSLLSVNIEVAKRFSTATTSDYQSLITSTADAGSLIGINAPRQRGNENYDRDLIVYLQKVQELAPGSIVLEDDFQIAGLLPSNFITDPTITFNPIRLLLNSLPITQAPKPLIVGASTSDLLTPSITNIYRPILLVSFNSVSDAQAFSDAYAGNDSVEISEFITNRLVLNEVTTRIREFSIVAASILGVIALIILYATLSRTLVDEHANISLYRLLEARTIHIAAIYTLYIMLLVSLIILASLVVAIFIVVVMSLSNQEAINAFLFSNYNLANTSLIVLLSCPLELMTGIIIVVLVAMMSIIPALRYKPKNL